jgi:hypothetical protein
MNTKFIYYICPLSPFSYALSSPTGTHPQRGHLLPSWPSFFNAYIYSSKCFRLGIANMYMQCFDQINTPLLTLSLYCLATLLSNSLQCIVLYYLHAQMQCFNIFYSLTFFFLFYLPTLPWLKHTNIIILSLLLFVSLSLSLSVSLCLSLCNIYLHLLYVGLYLCVHLSYVGSTYKRKWPFEPGLLDLTWCCPLPSIFLQAT